MGLYTDPSHGHIRYGEEVDAWFGGFGRFGGEGGRGWGVGVRDAES